MRLQSRTCGPRRRTGLGRRAFTGRILFAGGDLRQQAGPGQALVDDGDRHVANSDMVMTLRAGILEADMLPHKDARGKVVELLAHVLAELLAHRGTAGTDPLR